MPLTRGGREGRDSSRLLLEPMLERERERDDDDEVVLVVLRCVALR